MAGKDGSYIGTYNGGQFWVNNPMVEDISLEEITHALTYNVRFNGHTDIFWSVAQHSLLVERIMDDLYSERYCDNSITDKHEACLLALLHDFSEGYMSDIARPFKKLLPDYIEFEKNVQNCIYKSFGVESIPQDIQRLIAEADTLALAVEANTILNPCESWVKDYEYMSDKRANKYKHLIKNMCPDIVQSLLLQRIFYYMQLLGIENKFKNNYELYKIFIGNSNECAIIKNGKQLASFTTDSEYYIFTTNEEVKKFTHREIDNTMDLRKLL